MCINMYLISTYCQPSQNLKQFFPLFKNNIEIIGHINTIQNKQKWDLFVQQCPCIIEGKLIIMQRFIFFLPV